MEGKPAGPSDADPRSESGSPAGAHPGNVRAPIGSEPVLPGGMPSGEEDAAAPR